MFEIAILRSHRRTQHHKRLLRRVRRLLIVRVSHHMQTIEGISNASNERDVRQPPGPAQKLSEAARLLLGHGDLGIGRLPASLRLPRDGIVICRARESARSW